MNYTILIAAGVMASGLIGAVVAYIKVKPESASILVSTAQGVVVMQADFVDELRGELARVTAEQKRLNELLLEVTEERDYLRGENRALHEQVEELQRRVGELERNGASRIQRAT